MYNVNSPPSPLHSVNSPVPKLNNSYTPPPSTSPLTLLPATSSLATSPLESSGCWSHNLSATSFIFQHLHNLAHPGGRVSCRLFSSRYDWPHLSLDVLQWCRSCTACHTTKTHRHIHLLPQHIPIPHQHFSHIHVDLVGPLSPSPQPNIPIFSPSLTVPPVGQKPFPIVGHRYF